MWHIKKRSLCEWLTLYMFVTPFLLNFLQDLLHIPGIVKYTMDVAWIVVLLCMLFMREQLVYKKILPVLIFLIGYVMYVSVAYLFQYQSIFYFLWGIRNNMRYFVAFFAFVYFFDKDDIGFCLKFIDVVFAVHVVVSFFQFFVMGYKWDYLGGIFGVQLGCNGNSMILIVVVCIKSLLMYMHGKERLIITLIKCSAALIIAAMAELKFFFVIFLLTLIVVALITKFSWKKIVIIGGVTLAVSFASNIFTAIWGADSALTLDRIIELVTSKSYSSARDLGRFTAIPTISDTFLVDISQKMFGLGLGNCDTSSFSICNTPFYQSHSYLNYNWFSSAFTFIETGYVGLLFSIMFFVVVGICAIRLKLRNRSSQLYTDISIVTCVICIALFFYNSSLRTDIAYIIYFMLALPFVSTFSESVSQRYLPNQVYARHGG